MTRLDWDGGTVTGAWDEPAGSTRAVLVLGHGAGGDLNDALLNDVGVALSSRGIAVLRFNFPYREAGRKAPGAQTQSEQCYRDVATSARRDGVPLFIGGKSYGGRMSTHIASDGFSCDGLVLLSYPLHPPGKQDRIRDEHLPAIKQPMLYISGSRDPFATPSLMEKTIASLGKRAQLLWLDGGDHSLRVKGRKRNDVVDEIASTVDAFVSKSAK